MNRYIHNLRTVNTVHNPTLFTYPSTSVVPGLVRDGRSGARLTTADEYAARIAAEGEDLVRFMSERSRLRPDTVLRKGLQAVAVTLRYRAHSLVVPSKLSGTSRSQPALWGLLRRRVDFGTLLDVTEEGGRLAVAFEGERLGFIQDKHRWVRPLIPFGLEVRLADVTGHEQQGYTLGLNILLTRAGVAVAAINHALGVDIGGDGYGGERASRTLVAPPAAALPVLPESAGDGAATAPATLASDADEIRFWRDEHGVLRMSIPHVVRHSETGPEVGYMGSGPADAALSVLCAVSSREKAEALYHAFKEEVIARLSYEGGVLHARDVRRWIANRTA